MEEKLWHSSFNDYSLIRMKELEPSVRTGILYADGIVNVWDYAKKTVGADALHPLYYNIQYPGYLEKTRALGLKTHAWTVNEEAGMKALTKAGIGDHHQLSGQSKKNHSGNRRNRKCMMY